jgi:hypothetical protein
MSTVPNAELFFLFPEIYPVSNKKSNYFYYQTTVSFSRRTALDKVGEFLDDF